MKSNFTQEEINDRRTLVQPIVEAAYGLRGIALTQEKIAELAIHWEVALSNVPTNQLQTLYREGVARRCQTAEQFALVWDMKMESLAMRLQSQHLQKRAKEQATATHIPEHILNRWSGAEAKAA